MHYCNIANRKIDSCNPKFEIGRRLSYSQQLPVPKIMPGKPLQRNHTNRFRQFPQTADAFYRAFLFVFVLRIEMNGMPARIERAVNVSAEIVADHDGIYRATIG